MKMSTSLASVHHDRQTTNTTSNPLAAAQKLEPGSSATVVNSISKLLNTQLNAHFKYEKTIRKTKALLLVEKTNISRAIKATRD